MYHLKHLYNYKQWQDKPLKLVYQHFTNNYRKSEKIVNLKKTKTCLVYKAYWRLKGLYWPKKYYHNSKINKSWNNLKFIKKMHNLLMIPSEWKKVSLGNFLLHLLIIILSLSLSLSLLCNLWSFMEYERDKIILVSPNKMENKIYIIKSSDINWYIINY